jgi:predicted RNA-binding Zn ribbon-like protein
VATVSTSIGVDVDWLVNVVNERSTPTRIAAGELDDLPGTISAGQVEIEDVSNDDLGSVADGWFEVFRAAPDPAAVCEVLNDLLRVAHPTISAVNDGSIVSVSADFADSATAAQRLSARGAIALLDVVAGIGVERIGLCSAGHCVDVYIDRSPRRNRRYCSQLCQTRERVQRHRSRTLT